MIHFSSKIEHRNVSAKLHRKIDFCVVLSISNWDRWNMVATNHVFFKRESAATRMQVKSVELSSSSQVGIKIKPISCRSLAFLQPLKFYEIVLRVLFFQECFLKFEVCFPSSSVCSLSVLLCWTLILEVSLARKKAPRENRIIIRGWEKLLYPFPFSSFPPPSPKICPLLLHFYRFKSQDLLL